MNWLYLICMFLKSIVCFFPRIFDRYSDFLVGAVFWNVYHILVHSLQSSKGSSSTGSSPIVSNLVLRQDHLNLSLYRVHAYPKPFLSNVRSSILVQSCWEDIFSSHNVNTFYKSTVFDFILNSIVIIIWIFEDIDIV